MAQSARQALPGPVRRPHSTLMTCYRMNPWQPPSRNGCASTLILETTESNIARFAMTDLSIHTTHEAVTLLDDCERPAYQLRLDSQGTAYWSNPPNRNNIRATADCHCYRQFEAKSGPVPRAWQGSPLSTGALVWQAIWIGSFPLSSRLRIDSVSNVCIRVRKCSKGGIPNGKRICKGYSGG